MFARRFLLCCFLSILSLAASAHSFTIGSIKIGHPWARATVPAQKTGGAFLSLNNNGGADRLIAASSPASASVEMHSMKMEGDVMRMNKVPSVDIPSGKTVNFQPSDFHLMLIDLKAPLKEGDSFPLTLKFEKAGDITVSVKVEPMTYSGPATKNGHAGH